MSDDMMRDRLILPVLIPVGALAFLLFLALVISQILINVPAAVAVAIATMLAVNLLIVCSVLAARPNGGRPLMMALSGIAVVPLLFGAAAASGMVHFPGEDDHGDGAAGTSVHIAANNLDFDVDELSVPADEAFVIAFDNQEAQPHNVAILEEQGSATALFRGEIVTGPQQIDYEVEPIPAGEYYFLCDVHPNMNGTVIAAEGGGEGEDEGSGDDAAAEEH